MKELLKGVSYIEILEEEEDDVNAIFKATLRVLDAREWEKRLRELLLYAEDEDAYVVRVRKEYFVEEQKPLFKWYLMIWGNFRQAIEELTPILAQVPEAPKEPEPEPKPVVAPAKEQFLNVQTTNSKEGTKTVTTIPLPFRRGERTAPDGAVRVGSRVRGVNVTGLTPGME